MVKNVQKEGVFACDHAKTPQKESDFLYFFTTGTKKVFVISNYWS